MSLEYETQMLEQETDEIERAQSEEVSAPGDEAEATENSANSNSDDLDGLYRALTAAASRFLFYSRMIKWLVASRRNWRARNRKYRTYDGSEFARTLSWLFTPVAVVAVDALLLSYVAREVAIGSLKLLGNFDSIAEYVLPVATVVFATCYVLVELNAGTGLLGPREAGDKGTRMLGRRLFAVVAFFTLPLFVGSFSLLNSGFMTFVVTGEGGPSAATAGLLRALGYGLVALVAHGLILLFGNQINNAFGCVLYLSKSAFLWARLRRFTGLAELEEARVATTFRRLYEHLQGDTSKVPPFTDETREAIRKVFGDDLIQRPRSDGREAGGAGLDAPGGESQGDRAGGQETPRQDDQVPAPGVESTESDADTRANGNRRTNSREILNHDDAEDDADEQEFIIDVPFDSEGESEVRR